MLFCLTGLTMIIISLLTAEIENYRLIRTTYWTKKIKDKRPDESNDLNMELNSYDNKASTIEDEEVSNINKFQMQIETTTSNNFETKKIKDFLINFCCGFENSFDKASELSNQKISEEKRRIESFESLNQTKFERFVLNINLILILSISVGLFIFFSIPPQKHIFKHIHLNETFLINNMTLNHIL